MAEEQKDSFKLISENKKARFHYHIVEVFEAGLVIRGHEIKSIRQGGVSLAESFVRPEGSEIFIIGMHIRPYEHNPDKSYDPVRKRKLLLHKREIHRLRGSVEKKGLTIVPLKLYLKRGFAKLEIAVAKGMAAPDKRQTVRERELDRDARRAMKSGRSQKIKKR